MPLSYPFQRFQSGKKLILRPYMPVIIRHGQEELYTQILVDSGADYSMLRSDIARDYFSIDLSKIAKIDTIGGVGGETQVVCIEMEIEFGNIRETYIEKIPFQVPLDPTKDPPMSLLGRIPFFYRYQVNFRMGFTDDPGLGKFVIIPEEHKRDARKYKMPTTFKT